MLGPLSHQSWLSLRAAASRVGYELLGSSWSDTILDRDESDRTLGDITKDLRRILASGEVAVQIDDGSGPVALRAIEAFHFAFQIRVKDNAVVLGRFGKEHWECNINAHDLEIFLKKYRSSRAGSRADENRQEDCLEWLVEQMKVHPTKRRTKADCMNEAIERFGVSSRAFNRLWAKAIQLSGSNWNKPGRRKSPR